MWVCRRRKSISTCNIFAPGQHPLYSTFASEFYFEDLPAASKLTLAEYKEEVLHEGR